MIALMINVNYESINIIFFNSLGFDIKAFSIDAHPRVVLEMDSGSRPQVIETKTYRVALI